MAGNPLVDQVLLNRLSASVIWDDFTNLNVEPSSLGTAGIRLRLDGNASSQHRTMTGLVQSPEPYIPIEVVINLLKTQGLSDDYKTQMEATSLIGAGSVWPDVPVGEGGQFLEDQRALAVRVVVARPGPGHPGPVYRVGVP